ncbi:transposase [Thioalkalivibrio versutus]|uniref:transposase n=1 Tax=Thioalkalivibrio versutus TaxID=106634 RepID=UPI000374A9DD|nr:transposase [Thioalkalivibrio versutus]OOC50952.1 hypothetical protein B0684_01395 [Thioalkalivibrio versutus]
MPKAPSELPESQVSPDPKQEQRTRRHFTTEYKLQIIAEGDQCQRGDVGQLLRRESLYSSQLNRWPRERAAGGPEGLAKSAPDPTTSTTSEQLEKENAKLSKRLQTAKACIDLQKKTLSPLDHVNNGSSV